MKKITLGFFYKINSAPESRESQGEKERVWPSLQNTVGMREVRIESQGKNGTGASVQINGYAVRPIDIREKGKLGLLCKESKRICKSPNRKPGEKGKRVEPSLQRK